MELWYESHLIESKYTFMYEFLMKLYIVDL